MWKELQKSPPFFLSFLKCRKYHIFVTDYIKIWEVFYSEDEFITRLKDSNFGLEIAKSELLDKGLQLLEKPYELKNLKISVIGQKLNISMSMLFGFPLKLIVNLEEGSQELFFQKVTQPALKIIQDLKCSEQELRKLLITKDDEIAEYKSFGGKIRYTAIPPYNDVVHMKKHCAYSISFGEATIPANVLDKIVNTAREDHSIKRETVDTKVSVKMEPTLQENEAVAIRNIKKDIVKPEIQKPRKRRLNI